MVEICVGLVSRASTVQMVLVLVEIPLNPQGHFQDYVLTHWVPTNQSRSSSRTRNPLVVLLSRRQTLLAFPNPRQSLYRSYIFDSRSRTAFDRSQSRNLFGGSRNAIWWLRGSGAVLWSDGCVVGSGGLCREVCSMLL